MRESVIVAVAVAIAVAISSFCYNRVVLSDAHGASLSIYDAQHCPDCGSRLTLRPTGSELYCSYCENNRARD